MAASLLAEAGIPAPRSLVAGRSRQLAAELERGPLVLKPHRGYHGAGVAVVAGPAELPRDEAYPGLVFAQDHVSGARADLKVFAIGERVFGVRKPFSPGSFLKAGAPVPLAPEVEEAALRCGAAFGLELFGLDVAETEDGPRVLDVNYFPGYRGVPGAARLLADLPAGRGPRGRTGGERP